VYRRWPDSWQLPTLAPSRLTGVSSSSHRRRRSLSGNPISPTSPRLEAPPSPRDELYAETSGSSSDRFGHHLAPLPDVDESKEMSLSRSPSPQRGGGWASPGLTTPYDSSSRRSSPIRTYPNGNARGVTWATASARSAQVRGAPSFAPRNQGIGRHFRKWSSKLPFFSNDRSYAEKEKLGRGRSSSTRSTKLRDYAAHIGRIAWRLRKLLAVTILFVLCIILFYATRKSSHSGMMCIF
jgi:hypothetical protein